MQARTTDLLETWPHRLAGPGVPARLIERPNRFVARCETPDGETLAHVPDRGRLEGVLVPGARVWLHPSPGEKRRTAFTLLVAEEPSTGTLVAIDPAGANRHVRRMVEQGLLSGLGTVRSMRAEVRRGASRFDFWIETDEGPLVVEVKSVGAAKDGVGLFPDAPSERATKHLRELAGIARRKEARVMALFVAQRGDVRTVRAASGIDPVFAATLREVRGEVEVRAVGLSVTPEGVRFRGELPVDD